MEWWLLIIAGSLILYSFVSACQATSLYMRKTQCANWESNEAVVINAYTPENGARVEPSFYAIHIYKNLKIGCRQLSFYNKRAAKNRVMVRALDTGTTIKIWYNPANPCESVYLKPKNHSILTPVAKGIGSFALSLLILAVMNN
jgi:hypothetical protein